MKLKVEVLEKMIRVYDSNIKSFTSYPSFEKDEVTQQRVFDMVANRRLVASFIANDGVMTVPPDFHRGNVFFDTMLYSSCNGVEIY